MVVVSNKGEEDIIVAPDFFRHSFQDIGVSHMASITLHEFKNMKDFSDAEEEGEAENEEMEEEQIEEENNAEQSNPAPVAETQAPVEQLEEPNDAQKTASEVLFDNEGDSKTAKTN